MSGTFNYILTNSGSEPSVFLVKLDKQVLGGADAINFRDCVNQFLSAGGQKLLADLSDVELINSTGLGMLISAYSSAKQAGKDFRLINVPDKVTQLLRLTKLDSVLI